MPVISSFPDYTQSTSMETALEELGSKVESIEEDLGSKLENTPGVITAAHIGEGAISTVYYATIGTEWAGEEAPYTQTINVQGLQVSDKPIVGVVYSNDYSTAVSERDSWAHIFRIVISDNSMTVYSDGATNTEVNLQLIVMRGQAEYSGDGESGGLSGGDLHSHDNLEILNNITAEKVAAWDGAQVAAEQNAKEYSDSLFNVVILGQGTYGTDDLTTKAGVEGQLYFKVVE